MNKILPILVCCLIMISCKQSKDVTPADNSPFPPGAIIRLGTVYRDNKLALKFEYNQTGKVQSIYQYDIFDTLHETMSYKWEYYYNSDDKVDREVLTWQPTMEVLSDYIVTYRGDSIFQQASGSSQQALAMFKPEQTTRTGANDTFPDPSTLQPTITYSIFSLKENDLHAYFSQYYSRSVTMIEGNYLFLDRHFTEVYTYDTVVNPIWPMIENNDYVRRTWSFIHDLRENKPFAYCISMHSPSKMVIQNKKNFYNWYEDGLTFKYKLLPGTSYPVEQKWISNLDSTVYNTYTFKYIQIP